MELFYLIMLHHLCYIYSVQWENCKIILNGEFGYMKKDIIMTSFPGGALNSHEKLKS
jgi:hypothetical protein